MECIVYKDGYKYQLNANYNVDIPIRADNDIDTEYISLDKNGHLKIKKGYAWDGPSGPTFDTKNFMRGSLVHDALYQLLREKHLDMAKRDDADRLLQKHCRQDGMSAIRAWWVYKGVHLGGKPAADPANKKPLTHAPDGCP